MTTTNSSPETEPEAISPDDLCGVCMMKREDHGDRNHQFNMDGLLLPLIPTAPARNAPPRTRDEAASETLGKDPVARLQIRLIEQLVAKGVLGPEDLMKIFGGDHADT